MRKTLLSSTTDCELIGEKLFVCCVLEYWIKKGKTKNLGDRLAADLESDRCSARLQVGVRTCV
ncbi:hypothetical protein KFK09_021164 [Dendrobium nobile]|uniref:Uncharacterized protein n=1 Tax=Dendrobium nobile TaxID=94219 RepID=A0A8T3AN00_DENNO|nr:hypothetical protein KFK09_021164 [Dendrobium nobile]